MTNKQLYNLVFENFVQAKRELIKEGYRKESFKNVDFNEVFNKTKSVMQEEKIKSLKRENEMLKKRLQKEGLFDMFGKKQQSQTQQRDPRQVWLQGLTKVFGNELQSDFNKMDNTSLNNFYKPINNLFLEGGVESFWGALKGILERTDGLNFKDLNQEDFTFISKQLMLLTQLKNLFTIIETNPLLNGKRRFTSDALWLYANNTNRTAADGLDALYRKSKAYNQPMSKVLDLIKTYAKPNIQKEGLISGQAGSGWGGLKGLNKTFRNIGSSIFGNAVDTLDKITQELGKNYDDYRILVQYIKNGKLSDVPKIVTAINFLDDLRKSFDDNQQIVDKLEMGIDSISINKKPSIMSLSESLNKKRRRY